jgi:hypothetical protein
MHTTQISHIRDGEGTLLAICVPAEYSAEKIEFITPPENNFQVGLMSRTQDQPVTAHIHNPIQRQIVGTQEFLIVRQGSMKVTLMSVKGELAAKLHLNKGDSILLISGAHQIDFDGKCELLEVKQGPFNSLEDKVQL